MNLKQGTVLESLTEGLSLSCVRLEEMLLAQNEDDAIAVELENVSSTLGKISAKLAWLAASMQPELCGNAQGVARRHGPQERG